MLALLEQLQNDGYYAADVTWKPLDTPQGRTVQIIVDRGKPVRLRALRFTGVESVPLARIEKQVTSLKSQGLKKRRLRPAVLAEDLAAVRALYRDLGFTRVRIGQPQVSLATTGDSAEVEVAIEEGTRFTVGEVEFSGGGESQEEELRAATPIHAGETFSPRALAEAEQALTDHLDAKGYPDVTVESRAELSGEEADVVFEVDAGTKKTVGSIEIEGNRVTREKTIAKALTFGRGDLVTRKSLLASQQHLYRSGLFSNVRLTYAPVPGGDGEAQAVTVRVAEAPPWTLGLGVGYDSEDGARASFLLGYANLGGRAFGISLQGQAGTKENRGLLTLRRRRVFGNTIDALSSILYDRTVEEGFSQKREAFSVRLEHVPKPRWIRFLRYSIQDVKIFDITDAEAALEQIFEDHLSSVRLADIGVGLVRDTRDDAFATTRGGYGSIEGNVFTELLGSEDSFLKLFLRGSWTASMKRGLRFASFLRIGAEEPFADTAVVPLSERFFAGGSNTLRGFETDSVGGLDLSGLHAGGEALLIFNEELTFPIWRSLRGELFLDAGNVYITLSDFDPTDLRSSAGLGFRLETPIGPIRVEYGWKLDRREGESPVSSSLRSDGVLARTRRFCDCSHWLEEGAAAAGEAGESGGEPAAVAGGMKRSGQGVPEVSTLRAEAHAKLVFRFALQLTDPFAAQIHAFADLFERLFLPAHETEAIGDDVQLALVQAAQGPLDDRADFAVVDLLLLALGRRIRKEGREPALLVAVHVIVNRKLALQNREDHFFRLLKCPSPSL